MSVEVKIEMGHRAVMRDKPTEEGFTHDWTVFVRGAEGNSIDCFVEKVVFHLHESFPKPKRVIKEPPYSVSESGYAGFIMPIDVYFRTKEEPKRVTFKYDLYLRLQASPVSNIRIEKLTFQNPSDDFRNKLLKAGGLTGVLSGTAAGTSLSTQACAPPHPPPIIDDNLISPPPPPPPPKLVVAEKKPKPHVASKEIKSNQPTPPKPSQPFTDIFGAPIRTKNSPDPSSVKSKESGHSSQPKTKNTANSSSSLSGKEGKPSSKESHKSKDSHHSNKEAAHPNKEAHFSAKDSLQSKDTHHLLKEAPPEKSPHHPPKDSHSSKESHHTSKENLHKVKDHHKKEGHKRDHHSVKEGKAPKESGFSKDHDSKDSKSSKSTKSDKDLNKSGIKRTTPTDPHSSHGNVEKKKKISPIPSENSDKSSSSTSKHKIKDSKEKTEKQKIKSLGNSVKKEKEKPKLKSSPATSELAEIKEMPKPKPISPKLPAAVLKPPSPAPKPPHSPDSCSLDSASDESLKSFNKAHYSSPGSPASSISESSLHGGKPLDFVGMSYPSVISPLSNEEPIDEDFSPPPKRKPLSPASIDESSQESKTTESRSMPKLNKKHSHHKSSKSKSENFLRGNGSIHSDISMHHSPSPDNHSNTVNNSAYREELLELQRIIMESNDGKLLQGIVDVIEKTGKYEVTNTTFDFDLCALDYAIIQEIKRCLTKNCDNCF